MYIHLFVYDSLKSEVEDGMRLGPLSAILVAMAANPFKSCLQPQPLRGKEFEAAPPQSQAVASIVKVCVPTQPR